MDFPRTRVVYPSAALLVIVLVGMALGTRTLTLEPGPDGAGASGRATINEAGTDTSEVTITATGLRPNQVYTVWLVNMKPKMDMVGIGKGDYAFTSDGSGNGTYTATVSQTELERWQLLEIAHHPDGNPKNMKNIGIALKADLNDSR